MNFIKFYLIIIITAILGLVCGIFLIPDSTSMGLFYLNSSQYDKALRILDSAYQQGDYSIDVIVPLSRLYVKTGKVEKGIKIINDYISKHPKSAEARKLLSDYLKSAQKSAAYVNNLEHLLALTNSSKILKKLAKSYEKNAKIKKEIRTLARIINNKELKASPYTYGKLVYYYVSNDESQKALNIIKRFIDKRDITKAKLETIRLFLAVLLDNNKDKTAFKLAKNYLNNNDDINTVDSVTNLFKNKNRRKNALKLLNNVLESHKNKRYTYIHALLLEENNKSDQAFALLKRRFKKERLTYKSGQLLLNLSIKRNKSSLIKEIINKY